jgi:Ser/Thr protein kinase RdoA (MazF antagonist)
MPRFDELTDDEQATRLERLARKALSPYRLEEAGLRRLPSSRNTVYRVEAASGSLFVLRISDPERSVDGLRREIHWLSALRRETDLAVPEPILGHGGDLLQHVAAPGVPGFRWCTLYQWVSGKPHRGPWTPALASRAGEWIAALHQHGAAFTWPPDVPAAALDDAAVASAVERIADRGPWTDAEKETIRGIGTAARARIAMLDAAPGAVGAMHGALRRRHLLFDGEEIGAVGFEECRRGPQLYDLAPLWDELAEGEDREALRVALLAGYAARGTLPSDPEDALAVLVRLRRLLSLKDRIHGTDPASGTGAVRAELRAVLERVLDMP